MSRTKTTYAELYAIKNDINKLCDQHASFRYFFKDRINRFLDYNEDQLKIMDKQREKINKKYVVYGTDGSPVLQDAEGKKLYTFIDDEAKKNWAREMNDFMNQAVLIES